MSRLAEFHLFDQVLLTKLVAGHRQAAGAPAALALLLSSVPERRHLAAQRKRLEGQLQRLKSIDAPALMIDSAEQDLAPRARLQRRLAAGEPVLEAELADLARTGTKPMPAAYDFIEWLADDDARAAGPGPELSDGWLHNFSAATADVREALFGARPLLIDGIAVLGGPRTCVHDVADLPRIRGFFEAILQERPPDLDAFRRWYLHLNADRFSLSAEPHATPAPGPLAWELATSLATARHDIESMVRMFRNGERRRWCVQVCAE